MIIDFTIENFRSIKTEQLLSLFAENKPKHHAGNIAYIGNDNLGILRTCTIYGSNAAGKTNIIKAFEALVYLVCDSGDLKEGGSYYGLRSLLIIKHNQRRTYSI